MAQIAFADVNGETWDISRYATLPKKERPPALCLVCGEPLVPKMGDVREHHFAHRPRSECCLTNPETALHFNTKWYIAEQLNTLQVLWVGFECIFCYRLFEEPWLIGWDRVEVERSVESLRPDITLFRDGNPIGAIEVFVTHEVDGEKSARLDKMELPWIEVEASNDVLGWDPGRSSLLYRRGGPGSRNCVCFDCRHDPLYHSAALLEHMQQAPVLAYQFVLGAGLICYLVQARRRRGIFVAAQLLKLLWWQGKREPSRKQIADLFKAEGLLSSPSGKALFPLLEHCGVWVSANIAAHQHSQHPMRALTEWTIPGEDEYISISDLASRPGEFYSVLKDKQP